MGLWKIVLVIISLFGGLRASAQVEVVDDSLLIDGVVQPQLWSGELQYFRLRGAAGPNIPRETVIGEWRKGLKLAKDAGFNMLGFYIPWDFHEPRDGVFDFRGELDFDEDGRPDYPARDLVTFLRMAKEQGIRVVLARPGPYINNEWGFTGAGAVPRWFFEKHRECLSLMPDGKRNRYMDITCPEFLSATEKWFAALHKEVLHEHIGAGKLVRFLQLDNETNYLWQSNFESDYGPRSIAGHREFLKKRYLTLAKLNETHGTHYESWEAARPPVNQWKNIVAARDWSLYLDEKVHRYVATLRKMWERLGVEEPTVKFILAESMDAGRWSPLGSGLYPNFQLKNDPGVTGLMGINIYPLGDVQPYEEAMGRPFKIDHNAKTVISASARALAGQTWTMAPELEGCVLWRDLDAPDATMKQVYLSAIGRGLKAISLFSFHHGYNYDYEWPKEAITPYFRQLEADERYRDLKDTDLPYEFWLELNEIVDEKLFVGLHDMKAIWFGTHPLFKSHNDHTNFCFTPDLKPKPHFTDVIARVGRNVIAKHGDFLGRAKEVEDPVCFVHENRAHLPTFFEEIEAIKANSDWEPGLFGLFQLAGFNGRVVHWSKNETFEGCRWVVHQDLGSPSRSLAKGLDDFAKRGGKVFNFLRPELALAWGISIRSERVFPNQALRWTTGGVFEPSIEAPIYELVTADPACVSILKHGDATVGIECRRGNGALVQIGAAFYADLNSGRISHRRDLADLTSFFSIEAQADGLKPAVEIKSKNSQVIAWLREQASSKRHWLTIRSASLEAETVRLGFTTIDEGFRYRIEDIWSGRSHEIDGRELKNNGLTFALEKFETKAIAITPVAR